MQPSVKTTLGQKATGLAPDYFVDAIKDIDFQVLKSRGVKYLVLDVDHTIVLYQEIELDPKTRDFLNEQVSKGLIEGIFIASNSQRNLAGIADVIRAKVIRPKGLTRKPAKKFFNQILATIGCKPHEAVMVGDKLIMDVLGGNRAGMLTILVAPLGPDMLFDRIIRRRFFSKLHLRKYRVK